MKTVLLHQQLENHRFKPNEKAFYTYQTSKIILIISSVDKGIKPLGFLTDCWWEHNLVKLLGEII